ncbi:MAG: hypothetical protein ACYDC3_20775 [Candidatus Binataceae bacterium]
MDRKFSSRFRSPAAALRFYFRISALLCGPAGNPRAGCCRMSHSDLARDPGVLGEYVRIGSCVRDLDASLVLLLGEFYGPSCFAPRTLPRACDAMRMMLADRGLGCRVVRVRRATRPAFMARLRRRRLVVAAPAKRRGHFARSSGTWATHGRDRTKL